MLASQICYHESIWLFSFVLIFFTNFDFLFCSDVMVMKEAVVPILAKCTRDFSACDEYCQYRF